VRDRASYAGGLFSLALAGERMALGAVALKPWRAARPRRRWPPALATQTPRRPSWQTPAVLGRNDFKITLARRVMVAALEGTPVR